MRRIGRQLLVRGAVVGGWLVVIVLLALWLVVAIHRAHLAGVLIIAVGLATVIVVPLMAARLRS